MSVEKWSTEFGIQEIDESQIATVKRWRSFFMLFSRRIKPHEVMKWVLILIG